MSTYVPETGVVVLREKGKLIAKVAGGKKQELFPATGEIELLRWHRELENPTPPRVGTEELQLPLAGFGISIHLEDVAHQNARFQRKRMGVGD